LRNRLALDLLKQISTAHILVRILRPPFHALVARILKDARARLAGGAEEGAD